MKYPHVVRFVASRPWAMTESAVLAVLEVVGHRANGETWTDEERRARIDAAMTPNAQARTDQVVSDGVGVLPVIGVLSQRMNMFDEMSGGTSTQRLAATFRRMLNDPAVRSILLDIDSPGGEVFGVQELADEIFAARGTKKIVAQANSVAASGAYWIAAVADEIVVTPSGEVGSIGVVSMHEDWSKALDAEGIKVSLIHAAKYKTEGNPFEPLTDDSRAYFQSRLDAYYDAFVKAVGKGRGVPPSVVRSEFGQGRMVGAHDAVEKGMADRVATFEETFDRLAKRRGSRSGNAAERDQDVARARVLMARESLAEANQ